MDYKINFIYNDKEHVEKKLLDKNILIPNVGDTVTYMIDEEPVSRKVIKRDFRYLETMVYVDIHVTDD